MATRFMAHRASLIALVVALGGQPAIAQDQQGDDREQTAEASQSRNVIIVTAQVREQTLQDVPISVAAVGGEEIAQRNIANL